MKNMTTELLVTKFTNAKELASVFEIYKHKTVSVVIKYKHGKIMFFNNIIKRIEAFTEDRICVDIGDAYVVIDINPPDVDMAGSINIFINPNTINDNEYINISEDYFKISITERS